MRTPNFRKSEYAGLIDRNYGKYRKAKRVKMHGTTVRLLMKSEIRQWIKRMKLLEKQRNDAQLLKHRDKLDDDE